ncbi:hypothetical protein ACVD54_002149 [Enterobacter mori]|jgi:hypothetical protein|uniref:hypothetical protein n=1 Tax=Enterobacter mori TaxID=539813 RepID=UPI0028A994FC|nr:hypothetical protein [Enterobacter mori]HED2470079.1 hypothetical protein [Enterobacter mori]
MKIALTLSATVLILTGALIWGMVNRTSAYIDDRCFANFTYTDNTNEKAFNFKGNIFFEFSKNKTGQFNLSGDVSYQGQNYTFSRYVRFNYVNIKNNAYRIKIISHEPMAHDNVPAAISPLAIKILFLTGEYSMYLHKHDNNFITIGNSLSPLMNCVIQS